MKLTFKPRDAKRKMDAEELQQYLKLKSGNGQHKNGKAYSRREKHRGGKGMQKRG
jgi:hypothetical protein